MECSAANIENGENKWVCSEFCVNNYPSLPQCRLNGIRDKGFVYVYVIDNVIS